MEELINNYLFRPMVLVFILSFFLGPATFLYYKNSTQKLPLLLLNLFCFFTCVLTFTLNYLSHFKSLLINNVMVLTLILTVSIIASIHNERSFTAQPLLNFFSFLFAGFLGFLLGFKLFNIAALLIASILVVNAFWYLKKLFFLEQDKQTVYIQCLSDDALDTVYKIFNIFNIKILSKSIEKNDNISLQLDYKTSAITQHVLLKQLYSQSNIGKVIS